MKIGSVVFCVEDDFSVRQLYLLKQIPKKGKYYLVRSIKKFLDINETGILLSEIVNPKSVKSGEEPYFNVDRFWEVEIPEFHLNCVEKIGSLYIDRYLDIDDLLSEDD